MKIRQFHMEFTGRCTYNQGGRGGVHKRQFIGNHTQKTEPEQNKNRGIGEELKKSIRPIPVTRSTPKS